MLPLQISGHGIEITQSIHDFITKKFERLERHTDHITTAHVFLNVDKLSQEAEATLHIPGHEVFAKADSDDMYKTITMLVDKLIRQLDKHREKAKQ